ncbi:hypothetical protein OESDEN_01841 [Oesophagostomum dentatum]|uniref:UBX domain-containing protein n=1 Tax=Oesophagostomum dentatum TaxID=61180 RepID=A0A0B1TLT1_OESDE|nr:hypothetical protein OESDEN_01841 [Oesophagostomum dentatum]
MSPLLISRMSSHVAYTLHVFKFPFISLMCPRADNRMFSARRIYGFSSASDLVQKLQKSIDLTKRDVKELREKRNKLLADRRIREEQEREYKESAERDKRRILEAKRTRQEKQEEEENQRRRNLETEARRKVIGAQREQLRLQAEEQPTSGEMVNVQVRLPSGEKFARRFSLDDSLEVGYFFTIAFPLN